MQSAIELPDLAADSPQTAVENSSVITPQPVYPGPIFNDHKINHGKPSVVHSYCQRAINHGHKECIWLGIQHGRKWIAKDIQLGSEDKPFEICELRKLSGWWKRHSMFSAVGVKEIKVRILLSFSRKFDFFGTNQDKEINFSI
jgi:hypothetical protein